MANILSLALKINADASGLKLDPVQRALVNLGNEADKLNGAFSRFAGSSEAAARAQEKTAAQSQALINGLRDGTISSTQFAAQFERLAESVRKQSAEFERGAEITRKYTTDQERRAAQVAELDRLVKSQAITEETYRRALDDATGAERERAAVMAEGARLTEANLTADEKRSAAIQRFTRLLEQGAISAETYARSVAGLSADVNTTPQQRFSDAVSSLVQQLQGGKTTLEQFTKQSRDIGDSIASSTPQAARAAQAILELRQRFDSGVVSLQQYREEFARIQSGDIKTTFSVEVLGVREGIEATDRLRETIATLTSTQINAAVQVSGQESLDALRAQLDGIDGRKIDAVLQVLGVETIEDARNRLAALSESPVSVQAQLQTIGFESIDAAREALDSLQDRSIAATLQFFGTERIDDAAEKLASLDGTTAEAFLRSSGFESIDAAQAKLASLKNVDVSATLALLGAETIDDARARLSALADLRIEPRLQTIGFDSIDAAREAIASLQDTSVSATLEFLGTASIDDARERLASLDGTSVEAFLRASGFESIDAAQAKLAELQNVDVQATLSLLGVESIDAASARLAELGQSSVEVEARLRTAGFEGISEAQDLLNSLKDVNVTATAEVLGSGSLEQLIGVINSVEPKTVQVAVDTNADEAAAKVRDLIAEQDAYQKLEQEGARIAEKYRTEEDRRAETIERLDRLLAENLISQRAYNAEMMEATGINAQIAQAERERADLSERAARVLEANLTASQRAQNAYNAEIQEYQTLLRAGQISQDDFNKAVDRSAAAFAKATIEANKTGAAVDAAGKGGKLQFNELSGILSALPGPLGSVAGRFSGLASAGEGLARVFSGGLTAGISGVGASVAALVNPFTVAAAGVAAFGAAATAVVSGLTNLEDRVEKLGNTADKLGVSFEFIQTLEEAANRSGTSIDSVSAAFGRLQKSVLGVDEESKAAQKALQDIGVTSEQLASLKPEEQYRLIGEQLRTIEDPAKRTATAIALFGRAGADLIPFFNNISGAAVDVERFNAQLSSIDRARIDALGSSFDAVAVSLRGFGQELLTPFIGITQSISDGLASTFASVGRSIGALLDAISPVTSAIGLLVNGFLQGTSVIINFVGTALEPAAAVGRVVSGVIDSISQVMTAVAGRVNDAVISFREFFRFDAAAQTFQQTFQAVGDALARVGEIIERIAVIVGTAIGQFGEAVGNVFGSVIETVTGAFTTFTDFLGVSDAISAFAQGVTDAFGGLWEGIKSIVGQVGGFIETVLQFAEDWLGIKREVEEPVVATVEFDGGGQIEELIAENKEFQKTLDGITASVGKAIDESSQFGQAGFDAALRYQQSIEELKQKLDDGFFNEATFKQQADLAGKAFKDELARIEADAKLEIQIEADAEKTLAGLNQQIDQAIQKAEGFGQAGFDAAVQFQDQVNNLRQQFKDGILNETALAAGVQAANAGYDQQLEKLKQVQEEQRKIIEDDQKRIEGLLGANDAAAKVEQDILTVQREQARVAEQIAAARAAGQEEAATAAAARLAQLDQLQASLEDQQQALEQGFGQGFGQAFAQVDANIAKLTERAAQFGDEGFQAGVRLQEGIARAQQQARDGILNAEAFKQEVEQQQRLFDQELKNIDEANKARIKGAEDAAKQRAELEKAQQKAADDAQKQIFQQQSRMAEEMQREQERFQQERENVLNEITARRQQQFERDVQRIQELNTLGPRAIQGVDLRTQQGADLVLGLELNRQDPALIEQRIQTKLLQQIADGIIENVVRNINAPVSIVGMARIN